MLVYRIAGGAHATDLSGEGARIYGGRWNPVGVSVVYSSESVALATLELLANLPHNLIAVGDFKKVVIRIPDTAKIQVINPLDLPAGWNRYPHPSFLADIGAQWAASNDSLIMQVPCAVTSGEGSNYLINPRHQKASLVEIVSSERFTFDARIL